MASLVELKLYLEGGDNFGRRCVIGEELKPLSVKERNDLCTELEKVRGTTFDGYTL